MCVVFDGSDDVDDVEWVVCDGSWVDDCVGVSGAVFGSYCDVVAVF